MNASELFNHPYTGPLDMSLPICPGFSVGTVPKGNRVKGHVHLQFWYMPFINVVLIDTRE